MKRHISIFTLLLGMFAAVGPARAAEGTFQYWALSTHPCTITDCDGESLPFDRYNEANGGYYHVFNRDLGVTDLLINESGDSSSITAQEPEGLRFKGWWTKEDGWTDGEADVDEIDTPLTENKNITSAEIKTAGQWSGRPTIVAKYVRVYTVGTSVEPVDAGTATGDGTYEEGETVTLQASPKNGYSFRNWTKSGAVVTDEPTYEFSASANGTYVAVMTGNVYKVTLEKEGGTGGSTIVSVTYGEKASTPIALPQRFGWTFGGYCTARNGEGTKVYNADGTPADVWKTAGDRTLYAHWTPNPYDLEIIPPAFGVREIKYRLGESEDWIAVTGETKVKVLCGTICHVFVKEQSGYDLGSPGSPWTTEEGIPGLWKAEMSGNGLTFSPEANWTGYRLTVNPNGGTYQKTTEHYTWTERLRPGETNLNSIGTVTGGGAAFIGFFDGSGEPVYDAEGKNVEGTYWTADWPDGVFRGTGDLSVHARWGQPKLTVSVGVNDPQMGLATGGGSFEAGEAVRLEAVAKAGYFFLYWKKGEAEVSSANPYDFLASASTAGDYTAVFGKQKYTVSFFGNGGTNEMASQSFEYNVAKNLTSNKFERAGFDFAGWLTDPTNAAPTYVDGEIVSNLNARLFANWTPKGVTPVEPTNYLNNAYSVAADCATNRVVDADGTVAEALELSIDKKTLCTVVSNVTDIGENEQCIKMIPVPGSEPASMSATVAGSGKFEFSYTNVVEGNSSLSIQTNGIEIGSIGETTDGWKKFLIDMKSEGPVKVSWSFTNIGKKYDYALIDDIRWIPDNQPTPPEPAEAETVGVTFRLNDGTPAPDDIYTNLTLKVGSMVDLPKPEGAGGFLGWALTPGGETVDEPWTVPAEPVQLYAKWQYEVVEIPTAVGGLVYDGNLKTGVVEGVGYTLANNTATTAGVYSATATLASDCVWSDGETAAKKIAWSIGKATYDLSGISMTNATYVYDGQAHSLAISGVLPDGVTVTYSTNDCIEVGEYEIKASFTGDEENYRKIETELFKTLTILKQDDPPPPPPPPPVPVTNAVPVAVTGLVYDGTPKTGVPAGEGYGIVSNVATSAGTYVATAVPDEGHVWPNGLRVPTNIVWTIAKGTPDVSGITFPSTTYEYDGNEHSIGIVGTLPPGIEVAYSGDPTNRTEVGTNTVTASFVITDTDNWNEVSLGSLQATLTIIKRLTPSEAGVLYFDEDLGAFSATAAATYNGWLEDPATGGLLAVLQVKTAAAKAGKERKTTISVTPVGGKKKTYKSTIVGSGDHPTDGYGIVYGALGLTGLVHGFVGIPDGARVQAAKDFTKAKDPAEKSRKDDIPVGAWTIAAKTASGGYDCLSVTVAKTGKATVKGTLSDGTTVSVSGYGALGADAFAVPIAYSKDIKPKDTGVKTRVEFAGLLWIADDGSTALVSGSARWVDADVAKLGIVGPNAWTVGFAVPDWRTTYLVKTDDGYDVTPAELSVGLTAAKKFSVPKTSGSVKIDKDTGTVYVKPSGKNAPSNLSKFKLTLTAKTGQVKGSFKLYYLDGVKLKTDSVTVTGMMVGNRFYGNATVKKVGTATIWFE